MDKVLNLYKKRGETPLECLNRFKEKHKEYLGVSMTYAGRLDPLAEGVLVALSGTKVYEKEKMLHLSKEYELDVLFGASTDTHDVLGLVSCVFIEYFPKEQAQDKLQNFLGKHIFEYPVYSSKTVNGVPLFSLAREGKLENVSVPKKEIEIYKIEFISWTEISEGALLSEIEKSIGVVNGDFRQDIILKNWRENLNINDGVFQIAKIKVSCSSGTYMRSLAHRWGESLGVPALAYKIVRTKVGDFEISKSEMF